MKQSTFRSGQALITLLFFVTIAMMITTAAVMMILVSAQSGLEMQQGTIAYYVAKSGAENGTLQLLRNPNYSGETLVVGVGTATITVTSIGNSYTIVSQGTVGNFVRKEQVVLSYTNNLLTVTSEKEIF